MSADHDAAQLVTLAAHDQAAGHLVVDQDIGHLEGGQLGDPEPGVEADGLAAIMAHQACTGARACQAGSS